MSEADLWYPIMLPLRPGADHLRRSLQMVVGSPLYPSGHEQTGRWLTTWQSAPTPQAPAHGSRQSRLMHASCGGHSELLVQPTE